MPSVPSAIADTAALSAVADQRVLAGAPATLSVTFYDQDGSPRDAAGTVTVEVTRDDGTILVPAGTAVTHGDADSGTYTYPLTAAQTSLLDLLTAEWTDQASGAVATTHIDVAGGYYVSIADMRAEPNLSDATKFPTSKIVDEIRWFEDKFELYTGRAYVPRYRRLAVWGAGDDNLAVPDQYLRRLRNITIDTTALTSDQLAGLEVVQTGIIRRRLSIAAIDSWPVLGDGSHWVLFRSRIPVSVAYEYGLDRAPHDVREAAKIAVREKLLSQRTGLRELSVQTDIGIVRTSFPGPDRPFGIPAVDEVANKRRRPDSDGETVTVGSVPIG